MAILRHTVAAGYHDSNFLRIEPGLDALRSRPDFRQIMADLSFPVDPFAWRFDQDFRPMTAEP